jgi:hypothetical protein
MPVISAGAGGDAAGCFLKALGVCLQRVGDKCWHLLHYAFYLAVGIVPACSFRITARTRAVLFNSWFSASHAADVLNLQLQLPCNIRCYTMRVYCAVMTLLRRIAGQLSC